MVRNIITGAIILFFVIRIFGHLGGNVDVSHTSVMTTYEIPEKIMSYITQEFEIASDETVEYFYSNSVDYSFKEEGNIITDKRIISYGTDSSFWVDSANYEEISNIESNNSDDYEGLTEVDINLKDDSYIILWLSNTEDMDKTVISYIEAKLL